MSRFDEIARAAYFHEAQPFGWGVRDCCTLASAVAFHLHGARGYDRFRGRYSNWIGAKKILMRAGLEHPLDIWKEEARMLERDEPLQDGDLVGFETGTVLDGVGVICGAVMLNMGETGLAYLDRDMPRTGALRFG